jgi:hypothetical protein
MNSRKLTYLTPLLALFALICLTTGFMYLKSSSYHKEVKLVREKEIKVTLESGFGTLNVSRGKPALVLDANVNADKNLNFEDCFDYSTSEGIGYLSVNTNADIESRRSGKKHSFRISGLESSTWLMHFTDAVPLSFDVQLGMGKGDFDLTGLSVKDLNISAGASSFYLRFDRPNKSEIEDLNIESGLSKFKAEGLCNANFNHLKFEGGVGGYSLDFGGKLDKEVDVDIEVGLGSLVVTIPEDIGVKLNYEKNFIAHLDIDKDFSEDQENTYFSSNFRTAAGKINMKIDAGLGSVKVRRER